MDGQKQIQPQNPYMDVLKALSEDGFADLGEFMVGMVGASVAEEVAARLSCKVWRTPELLSANPISAKPANTYGGNFGLGALPLHTDLAHWHLPPRYLMLRCLVEDPAVATPLMHCRVALRGLAPDVVDRALFRPRRRMGGRMFLMRLRQAGLFRWDQLFLNPENSEARKVKATLAELDPVRNGVALTLDRPGRTLIIDNWTTMHGRSAVPGVSKRRIERAYFA